MDTSCYSEHALSVKQVAGQQVSNYHMTDTNTITAEQFPTLIKINVIPSPCHKRIGKQNKKKNSPKG